MFGATFVLLAFALPPIAKASDMKEAYIVCNATPDGPGKQQCMKSLRPKYRSKAFSVKMCANTFWVATFVAIDDSLGIHDADYEKALKMLEIMNKAGSIGQENSQRSGQGMYEMAGYYNSLGSEWKPWADACGRLAKWVILNPNPAQ